MDRNAVINKVKVFMTELNQFPPENFYGDAADFAIKHAADDRAAFIATLRERVEATIVPLKDAMFKKDYVDKADVLAILDELEAV